MTCSISSRDGADLQSLAHKYCHHSKYNKKARCIVTFQEVLTFITLVNLFPISPKFYRGDKLED